MVLAIKMRFLRRSMLRTRIIAAELGTPLCRARSVLASTIATVGVMLRVITAGSQFPRHFGTVKQRNDYADRFCSGVTNLDLPLVGNVPIL
jgi:hypothetical protein